MRIIGGIYRGRQLAAPEGRALRPTADRVREALFNRLAHAGWGLDGAGLVRDARVLDAFAGTGALGIEALSRGAAHVTFIDDDRRAIAAIRRNLKGIDAAKVAIVAGDAVDPPFAPATANLVLMDPPYGSDLAALALAALLLRGWIADRCHAVVEVAAKGGFDAPTGFEIIDSRRYGAAKLVFLKSVPR